MFNGQRRDVYFGYSSKDNLPSTVKFGTSSAYKVTNTYDELTRLSEKQYTVVGESAVLKTAYSYLNFSGNRTTGTVMGIDYTYVEGGLTTYNRWYDYDGIGNIVAEYERKDGKITARERYVYDAKNQLVRHNSATQKCTITYSYDAGGNITAKNIYAYTIAESLEDKTPTETIVYTYGNDAWKDELTSYKGEAIEYDEIGNPTLYRGWTMEWEGRQLKSAGKDGTDLTFTYDSDGIRTSKTVSGVKTEYFLNGTQILAQKTGDEKLFFFYDQQGNRVGMADGSNNFYYYLYNIQGDVVALADASTGKLAATYTYDAWGKCTVTNASGYTIGTHNPFRYRGYYYDTETGLYYLNNRYYDPEVARFINADDTSLLGATGTTLSYNLFAYCENNPVNSSDPSGYFTVRRWMISSVVNMLLSLIPGLGVATKALLTPINTLAKQYGKAALKANLKTPLTKLLKFVAKNAVRIIGGLKAALQRMPAVGKLIGKINTTKMINNLVGLTSAVVVNKVLNIIINNIDVFSSIGGLVAGIADIAYDKKLNNVCLII